MKYSVLMSIYKNDNPDFLDLALRSIYEQQTKKPDEIVIVIDGPITDSLQKVLDDFKKDKEDIVKVFPQEKNQGLGVALKIGSEQCTGDYIFRMDSDDISAPTRFEVQSKYVEEHPDIDVLGTNILEFNETPNEKKLRLRKCCPDHDGIVNMSKMRSPMNHMSVCIKKSALDKVGGYLPMPYAEDYYLWVRMIHAGCIFANLDKVFVYVRIGNGFSSRRSNKEIISSSKKIQAYMVDNKMISKGKARRNYIFRSTFIRLPRWIKKPLYYLFFRK